MHVSVSACICVYLCSSAVPQVLEAELEVKEEGTARSFQVILWPQSWYSSVVIHSFNKICPSSLICLGRCVTVLLAAGRLSGPTLSYLGDSYRGVKRRNFSLQLRRRLSCILPSQKKKIKPSKSSHRKYINISPLVFTSLL